MKTHAIAFSAASILVISLIIIGTFKTGIVSALTATTTDATSTASDTTTASTSSVSTSTAPATDTNSTSPTAPAQTQEPAQTEVQSQPSGGKPTLKLVHVVGTKYVDYFTDGTQTYSFPGNPDIDNNLNKPNAPIPSHGNLEWVSTSGMDAYDTASGDLDVGDYAQEADGSFVMNVPATTYTDATSSVPIPAHIVVSKTDPTQPAATPATAAPATDSSTTTSSSATTALPSTTDTPATTGSSTATSSNQQ